MNDLTVKLENCYGIKNLDYKFDFNANNCKNSHLFAIYASNGSMKSSFANTFDDISKDNETKDVIYPERITKRAVLIDNREISNNDVFVIHSFKDSFSSEQMTKLLVNENLKRQYEGALKNAQNAKDVLLKKLKDNISSLSKTSKTDEEICRIYGRKQKEFPNLILEIYDTLPENSNKKLLEVDYKIITNAKVENFLADKSNNQEISNYLNKYNELINQSAVLSKKFNHYSANTVAKSLNESGFFENKHSVVLFCDGSKEERNEINSFKDLDNFFQKEQEKILSNKDLKDQFNKIDKKLSNADLREFRTYLTDNQWLIPELTSLVELKKKIWITNLVSCKVELEIYVTITKENESIIEDIVKKAKEEKTQWSKVVDIFNNRFDVPFTLAIENQDDVILNSTVPSVSFIFNDVEEKKITEDLLKTRLSQGEKRAFYLLNILFEIEARKPFKNNPTLFIIDDIADSFDYKNKYAIVEYLYELAQDFNCKMLILSHNFDFYRTTTSRLDIPRVNRLFASKCENGIELYQEKYQNQVFKAWRDTLHDANKRNITIASITLVRNLAEYSGLDDEFNQLTQLLHIKDNTKKITFGQLNSIYKKVIHTNNDIQNCTELVYDCILNTGEKIYANSLEKLELEDKISLSITIRLLAEDYILSRITNKTKITNNQTQELISRYINEFPTETKVISILKSVSIITPEGIHLNSFMYEPILDMSPSQLSKLYIDVKLLLNNS